MSWRCRLFGCKPVKLGECTHPRSHNDRGESWTLAFFAEVQQPEPCLECASLRRCRRCEKAVEVPRAIVRNSGSIGVLKSLALFRRYLHGELTTEEFQTERGGYEARRVQLGAVARLPRTVKPPGRPPTPKPVPK